MKIKGNVAKCCGYKQTCFYTTKLMKYVFTYLCLVNRAFFVFFLNVLIAIVHAEATLKNLNKPDLIKPVLQLGSEMNSDIKDIVLEIRDLFAQMKKVEADVAIVENVNEKLVNQCWDNAQYSRREGLEVVGMPISIRNDLLEANVFKNFDKLGV